MKYQNYEKKQLTDEIIRLESEVRKAKAAGGGVDPEVIDRLQQQIDDIKTLIPENAAVDNQLTTVSDSVRCNNTEFDGAINGVAISDDYTATQFELCNPDFASGLLQMKVSQSDYGYPYTAEIPLKSYADNMLYVQESTLTASRTINDLGTGGQGDVFEINRPNNLRNTYEPVSVISYDLKNGNTNIPAIICRQYTANNKATLRLHFLCANITPTGQQVITNASIRVLWYNKPV